MKVCSFEGCNRKHHAKGLCAAHRRQQGAGLALRTLRERRGASDVFGPDGRRVCIDCKRPKDPDRYSPHTNGPDGKQPSCKDCMAWRSRESKYGITRGAWEHLFDSQGRKCRTCSTTEHGGHGWHTDHDHACCTGTKSCGRCVRSILCSGCNVTLGMAKDSPEILRALANYLENPPLYWLTEEEEQRAAEFYGCPELES